MAHRVLLLSIAPRPLFAVGRLVITAGVGDLVRQGRINPSAYLRRHLSGDRASSLLKIDVPTTPR